VAHGDRRSGQHSVDGEEGAWRAVGRDAVARAALAFVAGTVEAGSGEDAVPLDVPLVFAEQRRCCGVACAEALVRFVVCCLWLFGFLCWIEW